MKILVLGRGKTGSLVARVARERGHHVDVLAAAENSDGAGLTPERLEAADSVIDFTTPQAVLGHIDKCVAARKKMVVGTTGWLDELARVEKAVAERETGFLFGANFSIGVNLFYEIARSAASALQHGYMGQIFERHHAGKKDAPSGTAVAIQRILAERADPPPEITSFREGEVMGMHEVVLNSEYDTLYVCHDAKSRLGFAEGAVRGAEWLASKKGFFNFQDVWREL